MAEGGFEALLGDSFEALRKERPAIFAELCAVLQSRQVRLQVDGEPIGIRFTRDDAHLCEASARAAIGVHTTRRTILAMVDAECSLAEAILDDRLWLGGEVDDLIAFHDGLVVYLHGAVRSPSFPALLRRLRQEATSGSDRGEFGSKGLI